MEKSATMKKLVLGLGLALALPAVPSSAAATVQVDIVAFQYTPSGWITADPGRFTGERTFEAPEGTVHDVPVVHRGDTLTFVNRDPISHTVTKHAGGTGSWAGINLTALATRTLTIDEFFPLGTYVYRCNYHLGMRGEFRVVE
jgi:plastocyanin